MASKEAGVRKGASHYGVLTGDGASRMALAAVSQGSLGGDADNENHDRGFVPHKAPRRGEG